MTPEIAFLLGLIVLATIFFAFEWVAADVTALGLMLVLIVSGILEPEEAFRGFGSDTVLMILGLLIMTTALYRTGVVDAAGQIIVNITEKKPSITLPVIACGVAFLSAFISNAAATAFFVPVVIGFARKSGQSPSNFLLPLAFASCITSSVTLISTSTNIVISELLTQYKMAPMGMFELTPVGLPISIIGLLYILTIGKRLMPDRSADDGENTEFGLKPYLTEIVLLEGSPFIDKKISESDLVKNLKFNIIRIIRDKTRYVVPRSNTLLKENDVLLVEGSKESIVAVKNIKGVEIKPEAKLENAALTSEDLYLVEAIVPQRSSLIGKTLKRADFRNRYDILVLAINRSGTAMNSKMSETPLKVGDILLLQGAKREIQLLNDSNLVTIVGNVDRNKLNTSKAALTVAIFILSLVLATLKLVSFPVATLLGAFAVFVTGCITPSESYQEVDWKILILIGAMFSLGVAMEKTGAGQYLSRAVITMIGRDNDYLLLATFFLFALFLTQAMSNQAAAIVLVPIVIPTAQAIGIDPRPMILTIAIAASCSYLTPLEPSCLMVYGPGRYKFRDFIVVGAPLTLVIFITTMVLVPLVWPLRP